MVICGGSSAKKKSRVRLILDVLPGPCVLGLTATRALLIGRRRRGLVLSTLRVSPSLWLFFTARCRIRDKSCVFLLHGANEDHTRGGTAASHTFSKVRVHNAPCVRVTPDTQNHTRKTSTIWARHSGQRLLASRAAHAWHSATWPHGCSRVLMRRSKQTQHSFASSAASSSSSPGAGEGSTTGHKCQMPSKSPSACRIDHSPRTPPLREGCLVYACTSNQGHRAENARHRVSTCKTVECVSSRAGVGMQGPVLCIYGTAARPPAAQPTAKRPPTPQPTAETPAPLPARRSVPPRGTRQRGRGSPTETRAVEWASGLLLSV